ncbi:MAG: hypothetical protein LUQ07_06200 [Methanospirillum sp.]|nr:hypothetical protein [Methanospirillum sp.]
MIPEPDGFLGTLLAIEGISDARAVINGPNGCRGHPAYLSDNLFSRDNSLSERNYKDRFFFGQSRIPCTFLDSDDYIYGSGIKIREILPLVAKKGDTLLAIINSPGASLIGDDLTGFIKEADLEDTCMGIGQAFYSKPFHQGFDETIRSVLEWLHLNHLPKSKAGVNLLGLSIMHKYWEGSLDELTRLCELMGLFVISAPGAGSSVPMLRESVTASYNICVFPEYSQKTADFYRNQFGIETIRSPSGAPVGFDATEEWIKTIARVTGSDPGRALEEIALKRKRAYQKISRSYLEVAALKGSSFSVKADASFALPLSRWLYHYLGMLPVSIRVPETGSIEEHVPAFLPEQHLEEILKINPEELDHDICFSDRLFGKHLVLSGRCKACIEISERMSPETEFIRKTYLGGEGALYLLENIFDCIEYL